ncbi:hypothetical protein UT300003_32280 [Clostridium sardiniense]
MKKIKEEFKEYTGELYIVGKNEIKNLREKDHNNFEIVAKSPKGFIVMLND